MDLDGTLVATDTLWESLMALAGDRPLTLLQVPGWLMRGRSVFKQKVAEHVALDPAALPYQDTVVALAREAHAAGRPVVLASACDRSIADAVAAHLGCFTAVVATEGQANCKGTEKASRIRATLAESTPESGNTDGPIAFDYAGNASADLPVWAKSHTAYLVDTPKAVARRARPAGEAIELVPRRRNLPAALVRAGRPHQWVKNLLLVLPLLLAQRGNEPALWLMLLAAFLAMGLCASAVYLVNDLLDLRADRLHPTKRRRPLASGALPIPIGLAAAPLLVLTAVALAAVALPALFVGVLLVYTASAWLYSFAVKGKQMLDVIWLACLYVLRIIAGGVAVSVATSAWLLAFALFLFLSLAFAKRYSELRLLEDEGRHRAEGRGYHTGDQQLVSTMGIASGYMGVLVFALYINSSAVTNLYERPEVMWLICPLLLYWVSRLWGRAHNRLLRGDPLLFALTDRASYLLVAIVALVALIAM